MKKIFIVLLMAAPLLFSTPLQLFSLGWEEHSGYKYQKFDNDSLTNIQFSQSGDLIYSYSSNGKIRTINYQTGALLDSNQFSPRPSLFQFSRDGKTAVIAYDEGDKKNATVKIYDMSTKKYVCESKINFATLFKYKTDTLVKIKQTLQLKYSYFDYLSDKNELYVSIVFEGFFNGIYPNSLKPCYVNEHTGYFGVMEVKSNTLIKKNQINDEPVLDYLQYNDKILLFVGDYSNLIFDDVLPYGMRSYTIYNQIKKLNVMNDSITILQSNNNSVQTNKIDKIIDANRFNQILYRKNSKYYSLNVPIDVKNEDQFIPIAVRGNGDQDNSETKQNSKNVIVEVEDSQFKFYSMINLQLKKTLASPIAITSYSLSNDDRSLIIYNSNGEMAVMNTESITYVDDNVANTTERKAIYPNPTIGIITMKTDCLRSGQLQIEVTDISGKSTKTLYNKPYNQEELQFDISDMQDGMYIIKAIQNGTLQSFKVIKGE